MIPSITSMPLMQLKQMRELIQQEEAKREAEIVTQYGSKFCGIVGWQNVSQLPQVQAETLGLHTVGKYPCGQTRPKMLDKESAVRGVMSGDRPFVAIKVQVQDDEFQVLGIFVEVIFRAHSMVYHSAADVGDDNGHKHPELIPSSGGLDDKGFMMVRDLLEDKKVRVENLVHTRYLQKV